MATMPWSIWESQSTVSARKYPSNEQLTATAGTQPRTGCGAIRKMRNRSIRYWTTPSSSKIYNKLLENDEMITARRIKDIYLGKDETKKTLLEAFADHNHQMMASRVGVDFSRSTYTRYTTTKDHVSTFLKHRYNLEDMNRQQLQYSFGTDLEQLS